MSFKVSWDLLTDIKTKKVWRHGGITFWKTKEYIVTGLVRAYKKDNYLYICENDWSAELFKHIRELELHFTCELVNNLYKKTTVEKAQYALMSNIKFVDPQRVLEIPIQEGQKIKTLNQTVFGVYILRLKGLWTSHGLSRWGLFWKIQDEFIPNI